jgi:hypothetical protein
LSIHTTHRPLLLYKVTLSTPWYHPLDHIQTPMVGHTSSPETLVPDQMMPGKNPKTFIQSY